MTAGVVYACYACPELYNPFVGLSLAHALGAVHHRYFQCMSEGIRSSAGKNRMTESISNLEYVYNIVLHLDMRTVGTTKEFISFFFSYVLNFIVFTLAHSIFKKMGV